MQVQKYLEEIKQNFPDLKLKCIENDHAIFEGPIAFRANYKGKGQIEDQFEVEISFSIDNFRTIPSAKETGGRIPADFHNNPDKTLCLGAPLGLRQKYSNDPTLRGFIENLLVPFFYSFSFKEKYGAMPFGELSHGEQGIVEFYKELFGTDSELTILELLKIIVEDNYRGHWLCPCGSQNRLRDCHGPLIIEIKDQQPKEHFFNELFYCFGVYKDSGKELPRSFWTKRLRNYVKKVSPASNKKQNSN